MSIAPAPVPARPKKLRNGDWGALAQSDDIKRGDLIRISTKSGKSWEAHVTKVIWTGDGKAICETKSVPKRRPAPAPAEADDHDCFCHRQNNAGAPGTILFDGCSKCGCEAA